MRTRAPGPPSPWHRTGDGRMTGFARMTALLVGASIPALASGADLPSVGPYNTAIAAGGDALVSPIGAPGTTLPASQAWTLQAWIEPTIVPHGSAIVAGVGAPGAGLFLALVDGVPA